MGVVVAMGKTPMDGVTVSPFADGVAFIVDDVVKRTVSTIKASDEGKLLVRTEKDERMIRGAVYLQIGRYAMKKAKEMDEKTEKEENDEG